MGIEPFVEYTLEFCDWIPAMGFTTYLVREAEALAGESLFTASMAAGTGKALPRPWRTVRGKLAASMADGRESSAAPWRGMGKALPRPWRPVRGKACLEPADPAGNAVLPPAANTLENEYLSVTIEPNGSLTVLDKQKGQYYRDVLL